MEMKMKGEEEGNNYRYLRCANAAGLPVVVNHC